ncbi:MAG: ATP-dependent RNA helicase RhlE, partial [Moraxellaceae bacterium]
DYVHRIGRTGRADSEGKAISLVCVDEQKFLKDIERLIKRDIDKEVLAGFEPDPTIKPEPIVLGRSMTIGRNNGGSGNGRSASGKPALGAKPRPANKTSSQKNSNGKSGFNSGAKPVGSKPAGAKPHNPNSVHRTAKPRSA